MTVLDDLVARAQERAAALPADGPAVCRTRASFADAIRGRGRLAVIAEFKRESPSLGGIAPAAEVEPRVREYAAAGAAALSVLTEPSRFAGSSDDLRRAARAVELPLLMKDFIVAASQVRHAAEIGASAVLLIVRCLATPLLGDLAAACREHGLDPLVECHDEAELETALAIDGAILGVNNRDLSTLDTDISRAPRMLARVPADRIAVAESGYQDASQLAELRGLADAVLVGTALMRGGDPATFIREARR